MSPERSQLKFFLLSMLVFGCVKRVYSYAYSGFKILKLLNH